jgi:hypothetical protein
VTKITRALRGRQFTVEFLYDQAGKRSNALGFGFVLWVAGGALDVGVGVAVQNAEIDLVGVLALDQVPNYIAYLRTYLRN